MRVGDRVIVSAQWSSFYTMRGTVTQTAPHLMILIDRDTYPIRVGEREVTLEETKQHIGGAE